MKVKYKEESNSYTIKGLTRGQMQIIASLLERVEHDNENFYDLRAHLMEFEGTYNPVVMIRSDMGQYNYVYKTFKITL